MPDVLMNEGLTLIFQNSVHEVDSIIDCRKGQYDADSKRIQLEIEAFEEIKIGMSDLKHIIFI
jgi:hypothetical protein